MNFKKWFILSIMILLVTVVGSCGDNNELTRITLSGTLTGNALASHADKPIMVAVTEASDFEQIAANPMDAIIKYTAADKTDYSFQIDLSHTGLAPGDNIYVLAFIDRNYSGGAPFPDTGDIIGFYTDPVTLSPAFQLSEGGNSGITISVSREIFSYDASVSGSVSGSETGALTIIAYAGEINSSDLTDLDLDAIIGFAQYAKEEDPIAYTMDIIPYGFDVPVENVFIFALLDVNENNRLDSGDRIGYFCAGDNDLPSPLVIEEGLLADIDIRFYMDVHSGGGETPAETGRLRISGSLSFPPSYDAGEGAVFIVVADPSYLESATNSPVSDLRYFKKLPRGEALFDIDLSNTGLLPGDDVVLIGIWDRDYTAGFPDANPGDVVGFYLNTDTFSTSYTLKADENTGLGIHINRDVFDFSAEVKGTVSGDKNGNMFLIAYAGEINSLDFTALDFDAVIGFNTMSKTSFSVEYTLPILPYGFNVPIQNVYLLALMDANGNSIPDAGDSVGFHVNPQNQLPRLITIQPGTLSDVDIDILVDIPRPSGYTIEITGMVDPPSAYFSSSTPMFILVADSDSLDRLFNDPLSSIRYFTKLQIGDNDFELDLSNTGLAPEDDVMIIALWDKDYTAGFPGPSSGDMAGFYQNKAEFRSAIGLSEIDASIPSGNWEFVINRTVYDHDASIAFSLEEAGGVTLDIDDQVIAVAVQKDGVDDTWPNLITPATYAITDMDYVIGMHTIIVTNANNYSLSILPAIYEGISIPDTDFSVDDVYVYAILDADRNGRPDEGEAIGFYWDRIWLIQWIYFPKTIDVESSVNTLDKSVRFSGNTY